MLVALREKVDAVYCPTAVTPVTKVVPFSSVCSLAMNAAYVSKFSVVLPAACPMVNTVFDDAVFGTIKGSDVSPTTSIVCAPTWI